MKQDFHLCVLSIFPLPASGSVCKPPLSLARPPTPTLDVLGAVFPQQIGLAFAAAVVLAPGLTPGLAARSLGSGNFFKKFCDASCLRHARLAPEYRRRRRRWYACASLECAVTPNVLLPSISAKARSTVASEYDDAPRSGRCGSVCRSSSRRTLDRASGCWGVGAGSAAQREEKGQESGGLRTYLGPWSFTRDTYIFTRRSRCPSRFCPRTTDRVPMPRPTLSCRSRRTIPQSCLSQPAGTTIRSPSGVFGL